MSSWSEALPALDCHAHVNPTVTTAQIATLRGANIFAMTRTLTESYQALRRSDETITWGIGAHPGRADALMAWDAAEFEAQLRRTYLVGEVGLDRRGPADLQTDVLRSLLERTADSPCILSIHSTGRHREVLDLIEQIPQRGAVLHWFTGTAQLVARARDADCFFSVNAAMTDHQIQAIPIDRMLPETDFPSSKTKTGADRPGAIEVLERRVGALFGLDASGVRTLWYRNLGAVARQASVEERLAPRLRSAIAASNRM